MVTNAGEVFYLSTAHENDRVLLEIVALAGNVGDDFLAIGQANLRDFAKCGVWLFRGAGHYLHAHATALRAIRQRRRLGLDLDFLTSFADELVDCWHSETVSNSLEAAGTLAVIPQT